MDNIITATFNDYIYARTTSLWQYDYGQMLQIEGITLPATFEVHFSDQDQEGESLIQIGAERLLLFYLKLRRRKPEKE